MTAHTRFSAPSKAQPSLRFFSSPASLRGPPAITQSSTPSSLCAATSAPSSTWATAPAPTACSWSTSTPCRRPSNYASTPRSARFAYVALRSTLAKQFIADHPAHFLADVARRIDFFWVSVPHPSDESWFNEAGRSLNFAFISIAGLLGLTLALRRRVPAAGLFASAFLLLPIPYYLVTVHARFRHPLEPLIAILGVYLFQSADRTRTWSH